MAVQSVEPTSTIQPTPPVEQPRKARRAFPIGWIVPAAVIVVWHLAYVAGAINPILFSSPVKVVQTMWEALLDGTLLTHLGTSVGRWMLGFLIGGVLGLALGAVVGLSRFFERLLDPTAQMLRTVPIMGLVPLFIVWFGLGELPKIILIAFATFFQVYIQMYAGIRNIDRKLIEVGRMYELKQGEMLRRIIIPGAMPSLLQGVRLGLGMAWLALVIAELTGANSGVGYWMQMGREFMRIDIVLAALLIFAAVGKGVDSLVRLLERKLLSWRDNIEQEMNA